MCVRLPPDHPDRAAELRKIFTDALGGPSNTNVIEAEDIEELVALVIEFEMARRVASDASLMAQQAWERARAAHHGLRLLGSAGAMFPRKHYLDPENDRAQAR